MKNIEKSVKRPTHVNPSYQISPMNPDRYVILGLEFCSKPMYNLSASELMIAYRANYLAYYVAGFHENWNLFLRRLQFCVDPLSFEIIERNGYQLTLRRPTVLRGIFYSSIHASFRPVPMPYTMPRCRIKTL